MSFLYPLLQAPLQVDVPQLGQITSNGNLPVELPARVWNLLFEWIPATEQACTSGPCAVPISGAVVYLLLGVGLSGLALYLRSKAAQNSVPGPEDVEGDSFSQEDTAGESVSGDVNPDVGPAGGDAPADSDGPAPGATGDSDTSDAPISAGGAQFNPESGAPILSSTEDLHEQTIVPPPVQRETNKVKLGGQYRKTLHGFNWPDAIPDAAFSSVLKRPDLQFDMAMHFQPVNKQRAMKDAENRAESLQTDAILNSEGGNQFSAGDDVTEADKLRQFREQINQGERPFKVSTYFSILADDEEELEDQENELRNAVEDNANLNLRTCWGQQIRALESVAPIGMDSYRDMAQHDVEKVVLGQGVGALLSSATQSTLIEDTGIEMGYHSFNGSPIIKDAFQSKSNYNWAVMGKSGAGKSYSNGLWSLRSKLANKDTKLIILDPLAGFDGIAEALDAERIEVGGSRGLNPLEIKPPSGREAAERTEGDDPLGTKVKEVMEFFESFAATQGTELGRLRPFLNDAVLKAYERAGFTKNPETHSNDSPTVLDVVEVLKDMKQEPKEFMVGADGNPDAIQQAAERLVNLMRPMLNENGQYANLTRDTEFDFDSDVIYVDLKQQEGTSEEGGGLMMKLVFSLVYERIKATPKNVIFLIDEAHYLMKDAESLQFLKTRSRHARHYNCSIRYLTQEIGDFFGDKNDEQPILNNTSVKMFLSLDDIHDYRERFGLTEQMANFIEDANAGEHSDYSQALALINGAPYPIDIISDPAEHAVVDFDVAEDRIADLPGKEQAAQNPLVQDIHNRLLKRKYNKIDRDYDPSTPEIAQREFEGELDQLGLMLELLSTDDLVDILEAVEEGADVRETIYRMVRDRIQAVATAVDTDSARQMRDALDAELGPPDPDNAPEEVFNDDD